MEIISLPDKVYKQERKLNTNLFNTVNLSQNPRFLGVLPGDI